MKKIQVIKTSITGVGVNSPFGNSMERFWQSVVLGEKSLKESSFYHFQYADETSDWYEKNFLNVCIATVLDAIADAGLEKSEKQGCLILGSGMGISDIFLAEDQPGYPNPFQMKEKLVKCLKVQTGMQWHISIIANACCAGAQAIAYGFDLVRSGRYDFVVAGGIEIESKIMQNGFRRLNGIDEECCRPFDKNRKGIQVGEGAAFFVIQNNGSQKYGEILGQAVTNDAYHIVAPRPGGKYIQNAMEQALKRANRRPEEINAVVAHGTGTKKNDAIEAQVLKQIFPNAYVTAPKCVIGHTGGASGAFGLLTALGMLRYQEIPPIHHLEQLDENVTIRAVQKNAKKTMIRNVLVDCFAFGGTNTVLLCGYERGRSNE